MHIALIKYEIVPVTQITSLQSSRYRPCTYIVRRIIENRCSNLKDKHDRNRGLEVLLEPCDRGSSAFLFPFLFLISMYSKITSYKKRYLDFLLAEISAASESVDLAWINSDFARDSFLFDCRSSLIGLTDTELQPSVYMYGTGKGAITITSLSPTWIETGFVIF